MNAGEKREDAQRLPRRHMAVDLGEGEGDQLHPKLFDLMDDLELQLVGGAKVCERLLAIEQAIDSEIDAIILHVGGFDAVVNVIFVEHGSWSLCLGITGERKV